jgi:hypothetical protein
MASVKVFPRLDKANSEGKVPVYLRFASILPAKRYINFL